MILPPLYVKVPRAPNAAGDSNQGSALVGEWVWLSPAKRTGLVHPPSPRSGLLFEFSSPLGLGGPLTVLFFGHGAIKDIYRRYLILEGLALRVRWWSCAGLADRRNMPLSADACTPSCAWMRVSQKGTTGSGHPRAASKLRQYPFQSPLGAPLAGGQRANRRRSFLRTPDSVVREVFTPWTASNEASYKDTGECLALHWMGQSVRGTKTWKAYLQIVMSSHHKLKIEFHPISLLDSFQIISTRFK